MARSLKWVVSIDDKGSAKLKTFAQNADVTNSKMQKLGGALKSAGKITAGFSGAVIGAGGALFAMSKKINAEIDEMKNFSNATGTSIETLSGLKYVADLNKTSFETLRGGLNKMTQTMSQMQLGSSTAGRAFENLGVEVKNADGSFRDVQDIFYDVSDALKNTDNETERLTKSQAIFGKSAGKMGTLLNQGSEAMREQIKEAKELGVVLTDETAVKAERFNDDLLRMQSAFKGVAFEVVENVSPSFVSLFNSAMPLIKKLSEGVSDLMIGLQYTDTKSGNERLKKHQDRREAILKERDAIYESYQKIETGVYDGDSKSIQHAKDYQKLLEKLKKEYIALNGESKVFDIRSGGAMKDVQDHLKNLEDEQKAKYNKPSIKDYTPTASNNDVTAKTGKEVDWAERKKEKAQEYSDLQDKLYQIQIAKEERLALREKERHELKMEQLQQEKAVRTNVINSAIALTQSLGSENRALAGVTKSLSIGQAIINTYQSATKALASLPPPFGQIQAGANIAFGLAQVNNIRKQKLFSGGFPTGRNSQIIVNEQGQESVLNSNATKMLGRDLITAVNQGVDIRSALNNKSSSNNGVNITIQSGAFIDRRAMEDYLVPSISKKMQEAF